MKTAHTKKSNIRELWKITYRSPRVFKREMNKFRESLENMPICKGRNLSKIGRVYGVKRRWWFLEGDKKYRERILSVVRGA